MARHLEIRGDMDCVGQFLQQCERHAWAHIHAAIAENDVLFPVLFVTNDCTVILRDALGAYSNVIFDFTRRNPDLDPA